MIESRDIHVLLLWLTIREENDIKLTNAKDLMIDIMHSTLLERMLDDIGPLPEPPPLNHGYPWYSLVEKGVGEPIDVFEDDDFIGTKDKPVLAIDQHIWNIEQKIGDKEWVVWHDNMPKVRWHIWCTGKASYGQRDSWWIERIEDKD